ncbi:hypothetical protein ACTXT7_003161 [Hymenolepis weldensis]
MYTLVAFMMDCDLKLQRSLSEPDSLFIISPSKLKEHLSSSASSVASLIHISSRPPFLYDKSIRYSLSVGQLDAKNRVPKSMPVLRCSQLSSSTNKSSSFSASSSSSEGDACHHNSDDLQYSRFDDSPPITESSPNHICLERMMLTSIPRRKEFSEQFRDLAQLHENSDIPRAKWDDASRLFPKQFGLPPSVAISICRQLSADFSPSINVLVTGLMFSGARPVGRVARRTALVWLIKGVVESEVPIRVHDATL